MSDAAELEDLRASFRAVLDDAVAAGVVRTHVNEGAVRCEPLWSKAAELGWFALLTPEAHGGLGLGREAAAVLYEELGRVVAPLPMLGALAATDVIAAYGDEALQTEWLPRLAGGEGAGIDCDGDLIDGATASLLLYTTDGGCTLVAADDAEVGFVELMDRTRTLAKASFPEGGARRVQAAQASRDVLAHARIAIACDSIGGAIGILDITVAYLKTREQFGKPIGSFQALKHRCAEHKVAVEAARALVREAVRRWASNDADAEFYALVAKQQACAAYATVAMDAVQLHGGIGFTWEHVCHLYLKRAKLNQALFGTTAACRDAAAALLARAA
ncbi:MAG: acyl-CoA dehydrogenase family protein [Hyphomonadaceae bacterium]